MKKAPFLLCGLFLFGIYALPGKVCRSSVDSVRPPVQREDVPPCHRQAASNKAPCGKMVCCLLPDVSRGGAAAVVVPAPGFSGMGTLPSFQTHSAFVLPHRVPFEAQAPPGLSGQFSASASSRGPPLA